MSLQGSARSSKIAEAALNADAPVPRLRVRRYDNNGTGSFTELWVDRDSYAGRTALAGGDAVWKPVPKTVRLKNPSGIIHNVPEDAWSVQFAKSKQGKKLGWVIVGDDVQNEPRPEPALAETVWVIHPVSQKIVRVVVGSFDEQNARAGRGGWKFPTPLQIARRVELGSTYRVDIDQKET